MGVLNGAPRHQVAEFASGRLNLPVEVGQQRQVDSQDAGFLAAAARRAVYVWPGLVPPAVPAAGRFLPRPVAA